MVSAKSFEVFDSTVPPKLPRQTVGLVILVSILLAIMGWLLGYGHARADDTPVALGKPDVLEVIEIRGEINRMNAELMKTQVEKINDNQKIKAVFLSVDTPGGGSSASAALYGELAKLKVPVVGYCESLCASGGMYALMSPSVKFIAVGDEAIAGSIGVIAHLTRYYRLLDWAKIDVETYKSGEFKDDGNPTRAATDAERKRIQSLIDDLAQRFYSVVQKARPGVDMAAIKPAGIFIGNEAVRVKLVDAVMTREQAMKKAKELSGSKLIFTREELGKMAKEAHESTAGYSAPRIEPRAQATWMDDLHVLVETVQEVKSGETVQFMYRMPYRF